MTVKAEAQELPLEVSGSDHDDGAVNNQADFDSAFDTQSVKKVDDEDVAPVVEKKVVEDKVVEPEEKKVLTAAEKLEEAAKALDEPKEKTAPVDEGKDIMDLLPPQYAWARKERESGKLADWLAKQPKAVQKAANTGDVDDATYVLDLYTQAQSSGAPTKAEVKSLLAEYGDVKFTAPDGTQKTLKAIADEYGNSELFEAFAAMNKAMLGSKSEGKDSKSDGIDALQQKIEAMKAEQDFWEPVLDVHADAKKIARSGKLREWVEAKGTPSIKRMMASPDPDHAILVLDAYKEAMAQEANAPKDQKQIERKKQLDGLHGESLRPKRENKTFGKPKEESEEDFDAGFDAAIKKK